MGRRSGTRKMREKVSHVTVGRRSRRRRSKRRSSVRRKMRDEKVSHLSSLRVEPSKGRLPLTAKEIVQKVLKVICQFVIFASHIPFFTIFVLT